VILTNSHNRNNKLIYIFISITDLIGAGALVYCCTYNVIRPVSYRQGKQSAKPRIILYKKCSWSHNLRCGMSYGKEPDTEPPHLPCHNVTYSTSQSALIVQKYVQAFRFRIAEVIARHLYGRSLAQKPRILQTWRIGGLKFIVMINYAIINYTKFRPGPRGIQTLEVSKLVLTCT
jgi:hypothetical protein